MGGTGNGQSQVKYSGTQFVVNLFTFSSPLSLYITSFWGSVGHIHHRSCNSWTRTRSAGLAETTKIVRQASGICIHVISSIFLAYISLFWWAGAFFCSVLLLFVLVVNPWSIHHIQPFIYYLLPGQNCLLNKMHFCYPKPSDQASRRVGYVSFAGRCIFQQPFGKLQSKTKNPPSREDSCFMVAFLERGYWWLNHFNNGERGRRA